MLSSYCFSNEAQSLWVEEKVRTILCMLCQDEIQAASGTAGGQPKRCNLSLQPVSVTFLLHLPTGNFAVFPLSPFFTQRFDFAVEQQHMLCPKGCETCKVLQEEQQGSLCKKGGFDRGASVTELSHCFFNEGRAQCGLKYHLCVVRVSHWQMPVCAPTQGHRQAMNGSRGNPNKTLVAPRSQLERKTCDKMWSDYPNFICCGVNFFSAADAVLLVHEASFVDNTLTFCL